MKKLFKEIEVFRQQPRNTRILLLTTLLYSFVLPVINIFVAAYIMRNSQDVSKVVLYQLTVYSGIPLTFLANGFLLSRFRGSYLYAFGMLLSGVSMFMMTSIKSLELSGIAVAGLVMGMSFGFYWANRDYLVLKCTDDHNRNYYYGIETFFNTLCNVVVPGCVGWFIAVSPHLFGTDNINAAYRAVTGAVVVLTVLASCIVLRGDFGHPRQPAFVFFRFQKIWYEMLALGSLKGMVQGFLVTAPAMLIMQVMGGKEGALGTVQSIGAMVSAVVMYVIGRKTRPEHRVRVFGSALCLFAFGAVVNGAVYSSASVVIFMACLLFAQPMLDISYFPIQLKVIDYVAARENRNEYSYIFNHEFGLYLGRLFGCGLFIWVAKGISGEVALRVVLPFVALFQIASVFVARHILKQIDGVAVAGRHS